MFETMTQIGKRYGIDAKSVGKILYELKIRDPKHPEQKGFPFEQAITHGIAKAFTGRSGDVYYRYDIAPIKEEFEAAVSQTAKPPANERTREQAAGDILQRMLHTLNEALQTNDVAAIYRLKADIADLYALNEPYAS